MLLSWAWANAATMAIVPRNASAIFVMRASRIVILYAICFATRSRHRPRRTQERQHLPALAAEARAVRALRDRVAGEMVRQGADADFPRGAQGRRLAQAQLSRDLRRGAAHRAGA